VYALCLGRDAKNPAMMDATLSHADLGLAPRVLAAVLSQLDKNVKMTLWAFELSSDGIRDLTTTIKATTPLRIREHPDHGPFVENLVKTEITTPSKLSTMMKTMWKALSRSQDTSHIVLIASVGKEGGAQTKLQFVKLAGQDKPPGLGKQVSIGGGGGVSSSRSYAML